MTPPDAIASLNRLVEIAKEAIDDLSSMTASEFATSAQMEEGIYADAEASSMEIDELAATILAALPIAADL